MWYKAATVFFDIFMFGGLVFLACYVYIRYQAGASERAKRAKGERFSVAGTIHDPEEEDAHTSNQKTLAALGMPTVDAGNIIRHVPDIDPSNQGDNECAILTNTRINARTPSGEKKIDFFELEGGRALFIKGSKVFLLAPHRLDFADEAYLDGQREAGKTGDMVIENFCGHRWDIKGAMGDFNGVKSTVQVLTVSSHLSEAGMMSALPPQLIESRSDIYEDLEAVCTQTGQVLVAMHFRQVDSWSCYIGRQLTEDEITVLEGAFPGRN